VISWIGIPNQQKFSIDWIDNEGNIAFTNSLYGQRSSNPSRYPYLGVMPMKKGTWTVRLTRKNYRSGGLDAVINEKKFDI
jgi:hypothetical protein